MERDGVGFSFVDVFDDLVVGGFKRVGFWRERKIDGGLREREIAFGRTDEVEGIFRGERDGESSGFSEADVFAGHAHHAARDVQRIFAGFDHAREPVERGVGIRVANGFVKRGDEIEVLFAGFVVAKKFALKDVFEKLGSDDARAFPGSRFFGMGLGRAKARPYSVGGGWGVFAKLGRSMLRPYRAGAFDGEFERVVSGAGIAVGKRSDAKKNVVGDFDGFVAQAAIFVGEGAAEELDDLRRRERLEDVNLGAGEKWRDNFEGRVFSGSADEGDVAGFDVREKGVLLGFIEAMDFVDENDGAVA